MQTDTLLKLGRLCFAISIAFFGVQYLLYGRFEGGLPLVPPWTPGAPVLAYLLGAILILSGLSIATLWNARYSAIFLGTCYSCLSCSCIAFTLPRFCTMAMTAPVPLKV